MMSVEFAPPPPSQSPTMVGRVQDINTYLSANNSMRAEKSEEEMQQELNDEVLHPRWIHQESPRDRLAPAPRKLTRSLMLWNFLIAQHERILDLS